jgi:F420-dependent oxidoreductase-like protein
MGQKRIGIAVFGPNSGAVLDGIERAETLGIQAAWLTTGGAGPDGLTLLAAAIRTSTTMLGTAMTPTYPRHPVVVVQQVQVIAQLAPGRFRLGVGPSHRPTMVGTFGVDFRAPLGHLSEYLHILKALLREGSVDFQGDYYKAHASIAAPIDVPVMASALGPKAFELCGAESDGAISWVCPATYLRDVALPSMKAGADRAGRPVPPLIAHAPVCVHDNVDEVRAAIREQVPNPRLPFYQHMFAAAGYPEASNGTWSDAMIDGTALVGNESQVAEKVEGLLALGATEVLASPIPAGADRAASLERTLRLLAQVSKT